MTAFVAYRLPNQPKITIQKGHHQQYHSLSDITTENGFVFNAFDGHSNFIITDLEDCKPKDFIIHKDPKDKQILSKKKYLSLCNTLIENLKAKHFDKVILSRIESTQTNLNAFEIFDKLNQTYSNTFNYLISIKNVGCWIGATPELLVDIENTAIKTVSIAGTKQKKDNWGIKEIEEQKMVTSFISNTLKASVINLKQSETYTIQAGSVEHLKTDFKGELNTNNWKSIVKNLHPTPATCGLPKQDAKLYILNTEPHQRQFYTGFLGPIQKNKKQLFVNLRCLNLVDKTAFLYLGGGITAQSNSNLEWEETQKKAKTLLNILK